MAELPEDYRVVGVERRAPLVRKPSGQNIHIQQDGRLTAATIAGPGQASKRFAHERLTDEEGDA
jgi:hypothetical protein